MTSETPKLSVEELRREIDSVLGDQNSRHTVRAILLSLLSRIEALERAMEGMKGIERARWVQAVHGEWPECLK